MKETEQKQNRSWWRSERERGDASSLLPPQHTEDNDAVSQTKGWPGNGAGVSQLKRANNIL